MLALRYSIFALLATLTNLLVQYVSFWFYDGVKSLYVAMFAGTLAGLVLKYVLDKKYIFFHTPKSKKDDSKKFLLYCLMGIVTTAIFWGFEIGFHWAFENEHAKYLGASMGLGIGYILKYFLDKQFVFRS
ncbi:MAG: GtrA family protein [Sulfurimonas sp.]|nr:MAG: GtrA family protein [Sulfurimonas sp.]